MDVNDDKKISWEEFYEFHASLQAGPPYPTTMDRTPPLPNHGYVPMILTPDPDPYPCHRLRGEPQGLPSLPGGPHRALVALPRAPQSVVRGSRRSHTQPWGTPRRLRALTLALAAPRSPPRRPGVALTLAQLTLAQGLPLAPLPPCTPPSSMRPARPSLGPPRPPRWPTS